MVIDAGGGTVDITVHDCEARGGHVVLAEALTSAGHLFGAAHINAAFL
jgi:molecular chaperone DnaK (HSP70)